MNEPLIPRQVDRGQPATQRGWLARLLQPHRSVTDPAKFRRVQLLIQLSLLLTLLTAIGVIGTAARVGTGSELFFSIAITLFFFLIYLMGRSRYYQIGLVLLPSTLVVVAIFGRVTGLLTASGGFFFVTLGLVLASILTSTFWLILLTVLSSVGLFLAIEAFAPEGENLLFLIRESGYLLSIGLILAAVAGLRNQIERDRLRELQQANRELDSLRTDLEARVAERTASLARRTTELQIAARIARDTALLQADLPTLLNDVARQIAESFNFYHVGIFLLDEAGEYASLIAASSEGGRKMLESGHRLRVGEQGVVGAAAGTRRPYIALDVGQDAVFFNNPNLPETHSEMALPLMARGAVIGVLDIQSTVIKAFDEQDLAIMQTLADQLAVAIENTRLQSVTNTALEQLQFLLAEQSRRAWSAQRRKEELGFTYTPAGIEPARKGRTAARPSGRQLEVPLVLRGQPIGTISLVRKEGEWDPREREMAAEIAAQAALALENARLLQESRQLATRERLLADATGKVWSAATIDSILETAARELGQSLGATEVVIELEGGEA